MERTRSNAASGSVELIAERLIWPNFYIVGAIKCGTTSLYVHLKRHPQVFLPKIKEPHFFVTLKPTARKEYADRWITEREDYLALYAGSGSRPAIGDASPSYLLDQTAPLRIREVCPGARIIIMLRDPVERAYSHYLMEYLGHKAPSSFAEALRHDYTAADKGLCITNQYVEIGLYSDQVRRYLSTFGPEQVLICMFDELKKDSRKLFQKIAAYLGIDPAPFDTMDLNRALNSFRKPKQTALHQVFQSVVPVVIRQKISPSLRRKFRNSDLFFSGVKPLLDRESHQFLQDVYAPDVKRLEELLGRKLPELRRSWA